MIEISENDGRPLTLMRKVSYILYVAAFCFFSKLKFVFSLQYENGEDLVNWKNAFEESIAEGLAEDSVLREVCENHSNKTCADCSTASKCTFVASWAAAGSAPVSRAPLNAEWAWRRTVL